MALNLVPYFGITPLAAEIINDLCIDEVKPNTVYNHGTQMAEDMGYPYGSLKEAYEAVQERGTENE